MTLSAADLRPAPVTSYGVVRLILGLVLLTGAALKGHQLATERVVETGLLTSRWFLIGVVEFELVFGLWLSFGLYPRWTRQLALLCFSTFGCVALVVSVRMFEGHKGVVCGLAGQSSPT